jgi:alpha-L-rhamnosidase
MPVPSAAVTAHELPNSVSMPERVGGHHGRSCFYVAVPGYEVHTMQKENDMDQPKGITRRAFLAGGTGAGLVLSGMPTWALRSAHALDEQNPHQMEREFSTPPDGVKPWIYWWWLDGAVSKEGLTKDLEEMKKEGISGALIFDSGTGGHDSPKGPAFMSDEWREYFRHALQEAGRLGIEIGINLCSGWNAGGPWVEREDAAKIFVWSETHVEGPASFHGKLKQPELRNRGGSVGIVTEPQDWYRDISVVACRLGDDGIWDMKKAIDLTALTSAGALEWTVPGGKWTVLRLGYRMSQARTKFSSSEYTSSERLGWEIDPLSARAMDRHLANTGALLIRDAGPLTGQALKYFHIDSWEIGQPTWTENLVEEFKFRRGYDPTPYLPALTRRKLGAGEITDKFLFDFRRTLADLVSENYYGRLATFAHNYGLRTHCEAGGPFFYHDIDSLECLGTDDIPMGEFWSTRLLHLNDPPDPKWDGVPAPFFQSSVWHNASDDGYSGSVRQAVSCAHTYGKPVSQAESYTNYNDDWTEDPAFLKPFGDRAFCLGLNRQVLNFYVHQPDLNAVPGYQWEHVGTHFDRNITWWNKSHAWFTYLARCQYLLGLGLFAADILYFCGETIPNFNLINRKPVSGFDFDVINAQALLSRAEAKDGRITLPNGMTYRYLVIPPGIATAMTVPVLKKITSLVEGGATLVGLPPQRTPGLKDSGRNDEELKKLVDALWGIERTASGTRNYGKGRVIWGGELEDVIETDELPAALEIRGTGQGLKVDWIHRYSGDIYIFFVANASEEPMEFEAAFRAGHKAPELWDAVTGDIRELPDFRADAQHTVVPMRLEAFQSYFIVFRKTRPAATGRRGTNFPGYETVTSLTGPWEVAFDPEWGGAAKVVFEKLDDWSKRPEEGIRYYSGTATYRKVFDMPDGVHGNLCLDLGTVKNVAQVRLNGKELGVIWTAPWRVVIDGKVRAAGNKLEIEVVNLWPNKLIGDGRLPKEARQTVTNVRTYEPFLPKDFDPRGCPICDERRKAGTPPELLPSGLLGPVRILRHV